MIMNSKNESRYSINQPKIYSIKKIHTFLRFPKTAVGMHNKLNSLVSKVMIYKYLRYFYLKSHRNPLRLLPAITDMIVLGKVKP